MLATERHSYILEELDKRSVVRIVNLASAMNVSVMTVRRDIDLLAEQGLANKVHGGATAKTDAITLKEPPFKTKSLRELEAKSAIADRAAGLVQPGAAVALMGGSSVYALAKRLVSVPRLTIVTNSLPVSDLLHREGRSDQTVILAGGLRTPTDSFVGELTVSIFSRLNIDIAFMGAHGFDSKGGFSTPNLLEADTNRAVREHAKKLVVLADHTKHGEVAFSTFARLSDANLLITDSGVPPAALSAISNQIQEVWVVETKKLSASNQESSS